MAWSFEWDPFKAEVNLAKHGVSFAEAETVFQDPFARIVADEWHSTSEERDQIYGSSLRRRLLVVCYTERSEDVVRIISAREMSKEERRRYEEFDKR